MEQNPIQENIQNNSAINDSQTSLTPAKKSKSLFKIITLTILLLLLITSIASGFYLLGKNSAPKTTNQEITNSSPTPTSNAFDVDSTSENSKNDEFEDLGNNVTRYTSPALGITFTYLSTYEGQQFFVNRNNNQVCISYDENDSDCSKGQSVEVFTKNPSQTLRQAIEEQFLSGINKNDCFVKTDGTKATISFPRDLNSDDPWFNSKKCPEKYSETNGISYFFSDNNFPSKFAFFNIGQYAILGTSNTKTPWQDTFKLIN